LLKPGPRALLEAIGADRRPLRTDMAAVIDGARSLPAGYRRAGRQAIRLDMAEKLFRAAHEGRATAHGRRFVVDQALATSMGLTADNFAPLMRDAGFRPVRHRTLADNAHGAPAPLLWEWRAPRKDFAAQKTRIQEDAGRRPAHPAERPGGKRGKGPPRKQHERGTAKPSQPAKRAEDARPREGNAFSILADLIR
jgi:ATP-dependent RNA helicase SUPV3L1/SUV3